MPTVRFGADMRSRLMTSLSRGLATSSPSCFDVIEEATKTSRFESEDEIVKMVTRSTQRGDANHCAHASNLFVCHLSLSLHQSAMVA